MAPKTWVWETTWATFSELPVGSEVPQTHILGVRRHWFRTVFVKDPVYLVPESVGERELVRAGNLLLLAEFLPALYYGFSISSVKGTEISHHAGCQQHIPRNVHQAAWEWQKVNRGDHRESKLKWKHPQCTDAFISERDTSWLLCAVPRAGAPVMYVWERWNYGL